VPGYTTFRRIRAVKTAEEQQRLINVLRLTERGIRSAIAIAREGVTERELVAEFERTVVTAGGRPAMTQIFFGGNGSSGYVRGRDAALSKGEVIRFDVGCILEGFYSDIARNYSLGQPAAGPRVKQYYDAILAAESAAIETMRPGIPASDVFQAAIRGGREAGLAHFQRNHVGHGIGLEMYDLPLLGPNDHTLLEEGMVFEVETPYYELGFPGLQVEDTVLVQREGAKILCELDRSFQVMEA
jgi:Xaa-Pro aminopeptidase